MKPIRIVVPSSAGGTQDTLARLLGPRLTEGLKQPIVVENRSGAGGMMGASVVGRRSRTAIRCCSPPAASR